MQVETVSAGGPLARAATLTPRWYTDPEVYAREVESIFRREWLAVGRLEQVERPGDYFCVDPLGEPLVIARARDGEVRALSRVCRHRSMPVVSGAGNRQSFQCPYHLWTYGLDGRLLGAPEMQHAEGFDRSNCRLPQIRTETWEGWIFVNFDRAAPPLAPALEPLRKLVAPYRPAEMRAAPPLVYESAWNWKVMVENFIESYHHTGTHADTLEPIVPGAGTYADDSEGPYIVLHNPARDRSVPMAMLPPIDGLSLAQQSEFLVCAVLPLHLFALNPDSMIHYQIEPRGVESFSLRIVVCVPPGSAGRNEEVEQLRDFVDAVHRQDIAACSGVQSGLRSRFAAPGRLSHLEKAVWQFHRYVNARMRPSAAVEGADVRV